jgi:hypothetical protein
VVLENNEINTTYLNQIKAPEKALLSWYLYAYGNECDNSSTKIKCQLLKGLNVEDECSSQHLNDLLQWFSNDMLAVYKLNKCPSLPIKSAIQNTFEHIVLIRNIDTLSIKFSIKGLNTLQEKSWNTSRTERYLIKNSTLIKLSLNE